LKTISLPRINNLEEAADCINLAVLLLDGHSTHVTEHVVVFAGSKRILIIRLVAEPLYLCTFGLFAILHKKKQKHKT
jgi:hypothetical protein